MTLIVGVDWDSIDDNFQDKSAYIIFRRMVVDDESVDYDDDPSFFVTSVPGNVTRQDVKRAIELARLPECEFSTDNKKPWVNYTIQPYENWSNEAKLSFGLRYQKDAGGLEYHYKRVTWEELDEEARGEKRLTLRIDRELYNLAATHAASNRKSVNEVCAIALRAFFAKTETEGIAK